METAAGYIVGDMDSVNGDRKRMARKNDSVCDGAGTEGEEGESSGGACAKTLAVRQELASVVDVANVVVGRRDRTV